MVGHDFNSDINDFANINWEDLEKEPSLFSIFRSFLENPLCVPQDPIEDIEWYPNFIDSPISLNPLEFFEDHMLFQNHGTEQQEHGILLKNKPLSWKNSDRLEYKDKFVKLSDIQNLAMPVSVQKKEETCLPASSSSKKKPRAKRDSRKAWLKSAAGFENLGSVSKKSCSHCESEETPLWRNGPLGPKTLCNACGVRYASGRLLPEYRPAASPTFDSRKHSNFHSKIIKKDRT
ncbi:hypothetical protein L6164_003483 [Bauhinia variegata]|uniref:Uncharacterized protein n=1 Tax=Bauhinia variegata TaxID=167791 RepID=A0ACB9Q6X4_BAUVA|nr:hypothetical protein L6164_003483 [Bauhinia variegata]